MTETAPSCRPDVPTDKLILYVVKATPTSGANVVKPLMLLEALAVPYAVQVVDSPKSEGWFHRVNPEKMVPAMEDVEVRAGRRLNAWESSSCLEFVADKYDVRGLYRGRDLWERTQVRNWLTLHTAGLGATAKWWLLMKTFHADEVGKGLEILADAIRAQYSMLEAQLNEEGHEFIALPDRPTIADFATLPFANAKIAMSADIDFEEWPKLSRWSERMFALPAVSQAWRKIGSFGQ